MGHRLSKIYTRTGDDGTTGLGDGTRVKKDSARIEANGALDELNSVLGVLLSEKVPPHIHDVLTNIQNDLFDLGGELCIPGRVAVTDEQVKYLETTLDKLNANLAPLKEFILPGGTPSAAMCHLARTVCRRAERRVIHLGNTEPVSPIAVKYVNRLSDLLFVIARYLNLQAEHPDVLWKPGKNR